jgi:hypothetical protein
MPEVGDRKKGDYISESIIHGRIITLRNIWWEFDTCNCEDHKGLEGDWCPEIPRMGPMIRLVREGYDDVTWDEISKEWRPTK